MAQPLLFNMIYTRSMIVRRRNMILSSDELEIIEYLKTWHGKYMTMVQICRCAGGRRKFKDTPAWANPFMTRLVEAKLVEVNERGHYRCVVDETTPEKKTSKVAERRAARKNKSPANDDAKVIGDNYFPSESAPSSDSASEGEKQWWLLPQIQQLFGQLEAEEEPPK
jgi:hypothetical protein